MNRYLFLLAIAAAISFAGSGKAFDMYDIGDGHHQFLNYTGTNTIDLAQVLNGLDSWTPYCDAYVGWGNPGAGVYHVHGGGGGADLKLEITGITSADVCAFEVFWGGVSVGTDVADISGGISTHFFWDNTGTFQFEIVFGSQGNDVISIDLGTHYSIAFGMEGNDVFEGTSVAGGGQGSRDVWFGCDGNNEMMGQDNHDVMFGNWFDDTVWAGESNLNGEGGNDWMYAGHLDGEVNGGFLNGGEGQDVLIGGFGTQYMWGEAESDWMEGGGNGDEMWGGACMDNMFGDVGPILRHAWGGFGSWSDPNQYGGEDYMYGGYGDDFMRGQEGNDVMWGGSEKDAMDGGTGYDVINGESGEDYLHDMHGGSTISGGTEDDLVQILNGVFDTANGGTGGNTIYYDSSIPDAISNFGTTHNMGAPPFYFAPGGGNNWDAFTNHALFGLWWDFFLGVPDRNC